MRSIKTAAIAGAALSFGLLTACGGGGSAPDDSTALGGVEVFTVHATPHTTLPVGDYPVVTTFENAAGTDTLAGMAIEFVAPVHMSTAGLGTSFSASILFAQNDARKYVVGFFDANDADEDFFGCRSSAWTPAELAAVSDALGEDIEEAPVCPSGLSINAASHSLKMTRLTLPSVAGTGKSFTISGKVSWTVQPGVTLETWQTGSGSSGVGSGEIVSSGAASSGSISSGASFGALTYTVTPVVESETAAAGAP